MKTTWLILAGALALAHVAHAEPTAADKTAAESAFSDGQREYTAGNYAAAASSFMGAYGKDPEPMYLFNAAQAYRLGGDCVNALGAYEKFLASVKGQKVDGIEKVYEYIGEAKACAAEKAKPTPPTPPTTGGTTTGKPIVTGQVDNSTVVQPPPPQRDTGTESGGSALPKVLLIGGGVVILAIGIGETIHEGSIHDDVQNKVNADPTITKQALADLNAPGHTAQDVAIASYIVGGAALAAGVYLLVRHHDSERMVSAVPMHGGAAVTASWRF